MFLIQPAIETTNGGFHLDTIWNSILGIFDSFLDRLPYILVAAIVFGVFIIIGKIAGGAIHAAGERTRLDVTLAELLGRLASFVIVLLGVFVAAVIIFPAFKPGDLIAGMGITSVAIGFAFKDVLQNFFAGILILWRRPFIVGNQIKFREYEGTVEEITVRSTRLKTFDGERAVIPNGEIYANSVLVKTAYDKRRVRFVVGIGYTDDIEKGRETIRNVLSQTDGVLSDPDPWIYVSELAPSSVNFTVYFWVESNQANVLEISDKVATGIKYALDEAGVDMPYPHSVVLFHDATGTRTGGIEQAKYTAGRAGQREN